MPVAKRCQMVGVESTKLSIVKQCDLLSLHRSRYYYEPVLESAENSAIMRCLDEHYFDTPFYGELRLQVLLVGLSYSVNAKKMRRLMKLVGLAYAASSNAHNHCRQSILQISLFIKRLNR